MLPYIIGYFVIGVLLALYSEYDLARAKKSVAFEMLGGMLPKITVVDRIVNAVLVIVGWPLLVIKRLVS
jgi:hypothetical protein